MSIYDEAHTIDQIAQVMRSCVSRGVCLSDACEEAREVMGEIGDEMYYEVAPISYRAALDAHLAKLTGNVTTDDDTMTTSWRQNDDIHDDTGKRNLSKEIREWVSNCTGSFRYQELDRDLLLRTRAEMQNRSNILKRLVREEILEKDGKSNSVYHVVDTQVEWVDHDAGAGKTVDLWLPLSLHKFVAFYPKSIILFAGVFNAGKTALLLNTALYNSRSHDVLYVMSEMSKEEFSGRTKSFPARYADDWRKVRAAYKRGPAHGVVRKYNPNGLSIVDFIQTPPGDNGYALMPRLVDSLYDALGDGILVCASQKARNSEMGRGGDGMAEKPRLYVCVDLIHEAEDRTVCAATIVKAKAYKRQNMTGKTCMFSVVRGWKIETETRWQAIDQKEFPKWKEHFRKKYGDKIVYDDTESEPIEPF